MTLYYKYLLMHLRSQLQYKGSFLMLTFGQFFIPFTMFAGLYFMFEKFGKLQEWSFVEVALCFAIIHQSFSLSECFARGFDSFSSLIIRGDFDRLLLRPRHTVLQVLGSAFEFTKMGRLLQSLIVLIFAISQLPQLWHWQHILIILFMIANGVFIFVGIFMLAATLCFWTVQGLEVANVFTDGGREMAQYPLNIYEKWVMKLFTFIIPFGLVSYIPLRIILDKVEAPLWQAMIIPFGGSLFLIPCYLVWQFGVKHYRSTGS